MRPLIWIVGVPLLLVGAFFGIANRQPVAVDLWPLVAKVELPLYLALVGALYVGFLLGAAVAWWGGRHARARGREARRRLNRLEQDHARLQSKLDATAPPAPATSLTTLPPAG
jgi:uncharacterized integral membrane protein